MTLWITLLNLVFYLSPSFVNTYRLQNYGENNKHLTPYPPINHQSQTNCYINNNWAGCPVTPMSMLFKILADAHSRKIQQQNERFLHRLFEIDHNHKRRVRLQKASPPPSPVVYPEYDVPLRWSPERRMLNFHPFGNPSVPSTASAASSANAITNSLQNGFTNSEIPVSDMLHKDTTFGPATFPDNNHKSVETTSVPFIYNISYKSPNETTAPVNTDPLSKLLETTILPSNTTPIIYNLQIGLQTKSDEKSIKKYLTINAFTEVLKQTNNTVDSSSTSRADEAVKDNRTLTTASKRNKNKITSIETELNSSKSPLTPQEIEVQRRQNLLETYSVALDKLERKFYAITFNKLTSISPEGRKENGISFVQSALFLSLHLMAFSTAADEETKAEIDVCLGLNITDADKLNITQELISKLPQSTFDLKWRWSSRLVLGAAQAVSEGFRRGAASALGLHIGKFHGNETDEERASILNRMIEEDSGGAIRNTFDPEELSGGVRAVALTTLYLRARWRSAPTVLNGSRPFRDAEGAPPRTVRMIRINDYMRYANFADWNFQAIEIFYATRGLSLLVLVPHGRSLRELAARLEAVSVADVVSRMITMRVAVTMPLYTLRMTLLLPSKLKALGVNKLISDNNATESTSDQLKLSHAVQRLMFWAEAGRNAFKDDGIEWDPEPELELVVDRPYLFFVRWHNITLMNGNFVL